MFSLFSLIQLKFCSHPNSVSAVKSLILLNIKCFKSSTAAFLCQFICQKQWFSNQQFIMYININTCLKWKKKSESDVTCGQVWLPVLGICALHLTHPKCTHTPWTHGEQLGFGVLLKGISVVVLRVKRVLYIHSPHLQFLPARDSNS